jgi:hypothetical protein
VYRARIFVNFLWSPGIDSQPGGPVRQPYLTYRPARLHRLAKSISWNRFLGSLNVYKYGIRKILLPRSPTQSTHFPPIPLQKINTFLCPMERLQLMQSCIFESNYSPEIEADIIYRVVQYDCMLCIFTLILQRILSSITCVTETRKNIPGLT